ncbi:DNA gyrase [Rhizobium bangladeshense]|uniref:Pnap_2097 family protein n=1 Tax=Rhizobium bangladeshense TaxID=1138189 RepID=UPI001C83768B|nr:Pnap_2097 family protein [Rhizobium bangladeshense]MBX4871049.1 DNA gyrase [Rhizobium bangladeshense]MBX4871349.1 DNA gyrase [Rhizobium bangladeshense]MBX4887613.1 DNA gyrase [Rhizobium bangladeshense]
MGVAFLNTSTKTTAKRALMVRALDPHILLGMPHLNPFGLSETWLMKELGHRHWLMLAQQMDMDDADFRTSDGREAYAAICATSLKQARLELARANDVLVVHSSISQVSRTQHASIHHVSVGVGVIAVVEILSAFVARAKHGDNRSLTKMGMATGSATPLLPNSLAAAAALFRRGQLNVGSDISSEELTVVNVKKIRPSLQEEFNGAGLLYFANFQALATRAIYDALPPSKLMRRDVFFHGNINFGDTIELRVRASVDQGRYFVEFHRGDGSRLGLVATWFA